MPCLHESLKRFETTPARALVFDMDGTIIDTRDWHMESWRAMVSAHEADGLGARESKIAEDLFGCTNRAIFDAWFGETRDRWDYKALEIQKESIFRDIIKGHTEARPGCVELLEAARGAGLKIALATSAPVENAEFILAELGLRERFDGVVSNSIEFAHLRSKPQPDFFIESARKLGLAPEACIGFEDSVHGCEAVLAADMPLVAIAETPESVTKLKEFTPLVAFDFVEPLEWLKPMFEG